MSETEHYRCDLCRQKKDGSPAGWTKTVMKNDKLVTGKAPICGTCYDKFVTACKEAINGKSRCAGEGGCDG